MSAGASKERRRGSRSGIRIERSSGNVFEDLGLPDSGELFVKSEIAIRIAVILERRSLTQIKAAKLLNVSQADVSDLVRGKLGGFSTDRLFRFLNALGQDVEILMPKRLRHGQPGRLRIVNKDRLAAGDTRRRG